MHIECTDVFDTWLVGCACLVWLVGWSTSVPPYNPLDLIDNVERLLRNEPMNDMMPWVRGFKGKIYQADHETYVTEGVIRKVDNKTLAITELPLRTWTNSYKEYLDSKWLGNEQLAGMARVQAVRAKHTEQSVDFALEVRPASMRVFEGKRDLTKQFNLRSTIKSSNMVLIHGKDIKKYARTNYHTHTHTHIDTYTRT
jgi:DNA topoisomerase II